MLEEDGSANESLRSPESEDKKLTAPFEEGRVRCRTNLYGIVSAFSYRDILEKVDERIGKLTLELFESRFRSRITQDPQVSGCVGRRRRGHDEVRCSTEEGKRGEGDQ